MTKSPDLGLPPICSVIPDQSTSWASVSLTLGRHNPSCLLHRDVGGGGRSGEHQMSEGLWVSVWGPLTPLPQWVGGDTAPWCRPKAEKGQPEAQEVKMLHRRPCPQVAPLTKLCLSEREAQTGHSRGLRTWGQETPGLWGARQGWHTTDCAHPGGRYCVSSAPSHGGGTSGFSAQGPEPHGPRGLHGGLMMIPTVQLRRPRHSESQNFPGLCDSGAHNIPTRSWESVGLDSGPQGHSPGQQCHLPSQPPSSSQHLQCGGLGGSLPPHISQPTLSRGSEDSLGANRPTLSSPRANSARLQGASGPSLAHRQHKI